MTQDQADKIVKLIKNIIWNETEDAGSSGAGYGWNADDELRDLLVEATQNDSTSNH